jgi:hypothetical protein
LPVSRRTAKESGRYQHGRYFHVPRIKTNVQSPDASWKSKI